MKLGLEMKSSFIYLFLILLLIFTGVATSAEPPMGTVVGKLGCSAEDCVGLAALWSAEDGEVPAPDRYLLVPAAVSELEPDGSFELKAPAGEYFIGGQLRNTPGPLFGAPRIGDQIYMIQEQDETGYRVQVVLEEVLDIGLQEEFWTFSGMNQQSETGISGRVLDDQGQPVMGLLVFAFADPGTNTTPLAISSRSGEDGHFHLPMVAEGQVYLRARKNYQGGQPQAEDYVGVPNDDNPAGVNVKKGQVVSGVEVIVRKLPSLLTGENAPKTARPQFN